MPSKAKRMLISVACYQFSSFSLSPQNYKSVVPTALFIRSVTAGDNYAQEARRGTHFGGSQEVSGGSILQGRWDARLQGCTLAMGPFWGRFTQGPATPANPLPPSGSVKISQNKTGMGEKEGWKRGNKWEATLLFPLLGLCPPLPLCTAPGHFGEPSHHISGQNKMSLFLCLQLSSLKVLFACKGGWNQNWPRLVSNENNTILSYFLCAAWMRKQQSIPLAVIKRKTISLIDYILEKTE